MKTEIYYEILIVINLLIIYALLVLGRRRRKILNELRDSYRELNQDYDEEIQNFRDTSMELQNTKNNLKTRNDLYSALLEQSNKQKGTIEDLKEDVRVYMNMVNNQRIASNTLASENLRLQNIINDYQVHPLKYLRITTSKHNEKASIRLKFNEDFNQYEAVPYGHVDTVQEVKLIEHVKEEDTVFIPNKEEPMIYEEDSKDEPIDLDEDRKEESPE